jgi:hypothetical protein
MINGLSSINIVKTEKLGNEKVVLDTYSKFWNKRN